MLPKWGHFSVAHFSGHLQSSAGPKRTSSLTRPIIFLVWLLTLFRELTNAVETDRISINSAHILSPYSAHRPVKSRLFIFPPFGVFPGRFLKVALRHCEPLGLANLTRPGGTAREPQHARYSPHRSRPVPSHGKKKRTCTPCSWNADHEGGRFLRRWSLAYPAIAYFSVHSLVDQRLGFGTRPLPH